eukprot:295134-Pelagomonas_calceolata.AAC.2
MEHTLQPENNSNSESSCGTRQPHRQPQVAKLAAPSCHPGSPKLPHRQPRVATQAAPSCHTGSHTRKKERTETVHARFACVHPIAT